VEDDPRLRLMAICNTDPWEYRVADAKAGHLHSV
jgi:hypothetical protein